MGIAYAALIVLYIFICFFLILVVLVQQGKGADIAGAFGGGGTQTAFGARGATTLLHKLTTGAFVGFILIALVLTVLQAREKPSVVKGQAQKAGAKATLPVVPKPMTATGQPVPPGQPAPAGAASSPSSAPAAPAQAPAAPKPAAPAPAQKQ